MRVILAASLIMVVSACASRPPAQPQAAEKPYFSEDVFAVSKSDAGKFWDMDVTTAIAALQQLRTDALISGGCFRYEAIVDSNGRLFDVHPIVAFGTDDIRKAELTFLKNVRFVPTKENVNRTPIKSVFDFGFMRAEGSPSEASMKKDIQKCTDKLDAQGASSVPKGI